MQKNSKQSEWHKRVEKRRFETQPTKEFLKTQPKKYFEPRISKRKHEKCPNKKSNVVAI